MRQHFIIITLFLFPFLALAQDTETTGNEVAEEMVVTASKRPEKKLEAPSTIETVSAEQIALAPATAFSGALAQVKGVDFANGGVNLQRISTRGFSSSFNSRMLSLVDGRLSTLPGAGLPQGGLSSVSPLDIKAMELVLGPAGALYGSNTTAGVLNIITKNPWDEEGLTISAKAGGQSLVDANLRYAWVDSSRKWGFKLTGQFLDAEEFESDNFFDVAGQNQTSYASQDDVDAAVAGGLAYHERDLVDNFDVSSTKYELTGYYQADFATFSLNYGWSENDNFGITNLGRNRILGWEIEQYQFKANADHWYFQVTQTDESAGDTYSIQNMPGLLAQGVPFDVAQDAAKFINDSSLTDYELQGNYQFGELDVVAGVNHRSYEPSSEGSFLDDIPDASGNINDISRDETGIYVQLDYRTMEDRLRFTAAGRYDDFSEFDEQFSPKFGVTYNWGTNNLRLNYMTSYRAPEIIETHLFFFGGVARGNLNGFTIVDPELNPIQQVDPLSPEDVTTLELGYRGVFGDLFVEAIAYRSDYDNFISPLVLVANGVTSFAVIPQVDAINPGGVAPVLFTYLNYGEAEIEGWDLGMDYRVSDKASVSASVGYSSLESFENNTAIPDIPFNTPELKYKAQVNFRDIFAENTFLTFSGRRVNGYDYLSGRWAGAIDSSFYLDIAAGYRIPDQDLMLKASFSNATSSDNTELLGAPATPQFFTFEVIKKF